MKESNAPIASSNNKTDQSKDENEAVILKDVENPGGGCPTLFEPKCRKPNVMASRRQVLLDPFFGGYVQTERKDRRSVSSSTSCSSVSSTSGSEFDEHHHLPILPTTSSTALGAPEKCSISTTTAGKLKQNFSSPPLKGRKASGGTYGSGRIRGGRPFADNSAVAFMMKMPTVVLTGTEGEDEYEDYVDEEDDPDSRDGGSASGKSDDPGAEDYSASKIQESPVNEMDLESPTEPCCSSPTTCNHPQKQRRFVIITL